LLSMFFGCEGLSGGRDMVVKSMRGERREV